MTWKRRVALFTILVVNAIVLFAIVRRGPALFLQARNKASEPITVSRVFAPKLPAGFLSHQTIEPDWARLSFSDKNSKDDIRYKLAFEKPPLVFGVVTKTVRAAQIAIGNGDALLAAMDAPSGKALGGAVGNRVSLIRPLPHVAVEIPSFMSIAESRQVAAELKLMESELTEEMLRAPKLVSPAFTISDTTRPNNLSWLWAVQPKTVGRHALVLEFPTPGTFDFKWENPAVKADIVSARGNTVTAYVQVLDELGLTQFQSSILKAVAAVATFLGTVFAYPFLKNRFERQPAPQSNPVPQPATETNQPGQRKKRRKRG